MAVLLALWYQPILCAVSSERPVADQYGEADQPRSDWHVLPTCFTNFCNTSRPLGNFSNRRLPPLGRPLEL